MESISMSYSEGVYACGALKTRIDAIEKRIEKNAKTPNRRHLDTELAALKSAFATINSAVSEHVMMVRIDFRARQKSPSSE
jgi:hypothetical protein